MSEANEPKTKKISLTGIQSTGMPHVGNYLGAIRPALNMAQSGEYHGHYFIADYHSLNSIHSAETLRNNTYEVAACWLACGLDPESTVIYRQSDIPEIPELAWILGCFTHKGLMNRAHSYKAAVQGNEENQKDPDHGINIGLYTYPILMAADILIVGADEVPVGPDQVQHLEMARDIAGVINHNFGEVLKLPKAITKDEILIDGLDGRKMSKSYGNHIPLFETEKRVKKLINKIKTDSSEPHEPKEIEGNLIFKLYTHFASLEEQESLKERYKTGIGWGEAKAELFQAVNRELTPMRERYNYLMDNKSEIDEILEAGAQKIRAKSRPLLENLKEAVGISKFK
ncbi:MAG: tryptophan--tRNA ligase [Bacteriovoracaceae bacterium]